MFVPFYLTSLPVGNLVELLVLGQKFFPKPAFLRLSISVTF